MATVKNKNGTDSADVITIDKSDYVYILNHVSGTPTNSYFKISAKGGSDTIYVKPSNISQAMPIDTKIYCGAGNDTVNLGPDPGWNTIYLEKGTNTVNVKTNSGQFNKIVGGTGVDKIYISASYNYKYPSSTQKFYGGVSASLGQGNDIIKITAGNGGVKLADTYTVTSDSYTLNGGADNDSYTIAGGDAYYIKDTSGSNKLNISKGNRNLVEFGSGKDTIIISGTSSTSSTTKENRINAGSGVDTIKVKGGYANRIDASGGNDKVILTSGLKNEVSLGGGSNLVYISGGNNNKVKNYDSYNNKIWVNWNSLTTSKTAATITTSTSDKLYIYTGSVSYKNFKINKVSSSSYKITYGTKTLALNSPTTKIVFQSKSQTASKGTAFSGSEITKAFRTLGVASLSFSNKSLTASSVSVGTSMQKTTGLKITGTTA